MSHSDSDRTDWGRLRRSPVVLGLVALAIVIPTLTALALGREQIPQPIAFNHQKHTGELGLACTFCHQYAETGAHSGLPDATVCSICHSAVQGTSPEAARVTELLDAGDPIQFNKLFRLPDHVFYTHRRHVAIAELECAECHGDIAETTRPPPRALVKIDMDFCMDCHRENSATEDCNACHR